MEQQIVDQIKLSGSVPHQDMSALGIFMHADGIVKIVIILLVLASIWTWAVIFQKVVRLRKLTTAAGTFEDRFWAGGSLDALFEKMGGNVIDPMSAIFVSAMKEWKSATDKNLMATAAMRASLLQRIERAINGTIGRELTTLERRMTWLASVGSVSPFIGLFGTVWGIMNSFSAIANSQNTSLAVVAPGIAEALFATAIGLVAAIPAVLAYNKFNSEISRYAERMDHFGNDLLATMSRNLEDM
jgi:biopolymer transport protein TolQ